MKLHSTGIHGIFKISATKKEYVSSKQQITGCCWDKQRQCHDLHQYQPPFLSFPGTAISHVVSNKVFSSYLKIKAVPTNRMSFTHEFWMPKSVE